jgi:hypothetical protein
MTLLRAVAGILIVGVIATLATDLWQLLLQIAIGRPLGSWALIGRWVAGFRLWRLSTLFTVH